MLGGSLYGDLREYPGSWTYDDSTLTRISVAHTNDLHATFPPPRIGLLSVFVVKGYSWHTLSPLLRTTGMSNPSGGNPSGKRFPPPGKFWTQPKIVARPAQLRKKHCPCILEGRLTTNPILSALHLQGLKSNIYVHFHLVNKPLIGISFQKWNLNEERN